jgi:hypothetical protein
LRKNCHYAHLLILPEGKANGGRWAVGGSILLGDNSLGASCGTQCGQTQFYSLRSAPNLAFLMSAS